MKGFCIMFLFGGRRRVVATRAGNGELAHTIRKDLLYAAAASRGKRSFKIRWDLIRVFGNKTQIWDLGVSGATSSINN